ncbi:lysozyme inhibitor [Leptospira noumeaensis]|uniref:Lysozyme inhibitor n=1 Tax=Leptospira noumeaensis TaxID=2484964 RepID=A0A4V3JJU6_9LEPT|nr:MliC family protein [Leptospira noumeaensis]TGK81994.1 lysozyme inhibitor [Leptospira noumeaensis]
MKTSYFLKFIPISFFTLAAVICLLSSSCSPAYEEIEVVYQATDGQRITAVYHNPTNDESEFSVTLKFPSGQSVTLNQGAAASGVRYTDDKTLVWWTKGGGAIMMKPDGKNDWEITGTYTEIPMHHNR